MSTTASVCLDPACPARPSSTTSRPTTTATTTTTERQRTITASAAPRDVLRHHRCHRHKNPSHLSPSNQDASFTTAVSIYILLTRQARVYLLAWTDSVSVLELGPWTTWSPLCGGPSSRGREVACVEEEGGGGGGGSEVIPPERCGYEDLDLLKSEHVNKEPC